MHDPLGEEIAKLLRVKPELVALETAICKGRPWVRHDVIIFRFDPFPWVWSALEPPEIPRR